ncbi:cation diffusion facilitator family transporter [Pseudarthrobacter sp. NamE5]|uniref:cation diffusion facilitator family transporter n=1 Tax=Pseudarthrobacter sp. NamE5 TaxID=2576839 RepID=UPI00110A2C65|nr:cation diffusion facilitator family transporter [Pseudarthrobacter sp. NamE5]TLM87017.1 cation diffusion facilitator family transporter [Pseudarthrobacter sp. NamE5]
MTNVKSSSDAIRFGHTKLPAEQQKALRQAIRIEWITMGFLAVTATLVFLVLGNSQAMKAAWIEDLLSFLPPVSFLVAARIIRKPPSEDHPYGYHRSTGVAHVVAAVALTVMGGYLLVESALGLLKAEHPTIGGISLFGTTIWLGWLMMGVMILTAAPPVVLGRMKMKLAEQLHDKVLYADADMNKADWMTAVAAVAGVAGIGFGLWWADYTAALIISTSILRDGIRNTKGAVSALMDKRAMTYDDREPHPLGEKLDDYLRNLDWTVDAKSRIRDEGHVFHVESFVVPAGSSVPTLAQLEAARDACVAMDWKVQDMVIVPVAELPSEFVPGPTSGGER